MTQSKRRVWLKRAGHWCIASVMLFLLSDAAYSNLHTRTLIDQRHVSCSFAGAFDTAQDESNAVSHFSCDDNGNVSSWDIRWQGNRRVILAGEKFACLSTTVERLHLFGLWPSDARQPRYFCRIA